MIRITLAGLAAAMLLTVAASAQTTSTTTTTTTMTCKDHMMKFEPMMTGMTDATKKTDAMTRYKLAQDRMTANDEAGCMVIMNGLMTDHGGSR